MSKQKKINHELKTISSYIGLIISKYLIFFLLAVTFYPLKIVPGYILLAGIIFPAALKFAFNDDSADNSVSGLTLFKTAQKYKFSYKNYKIESLNYILIILLIMVWQYTINKNEAFDFPLNIIPSIMLIIYILSRFLAKIIFRFKLHHDFMNINI